MSALNNVTEETIVNIESLDVAEEMLDKLSRMPSERHTLPLSRYDAIPYDHRIYADNYNLQIGDAWFIIPPEFIMITSEAQTGKIVTLRQENTQKSKSGYHRRTILVDLVAHGSDQINGFKVPSPTGYYYVDGLRPLLAQFKRTPFLPIFNELINTGYGIHTVALQSITIQTVENFPSVMTAQLTLQEVNMMPYIEMHSYLFQYLIDWDLMRFYYQSALTEVHEYKKLQSIPINKEQNHLILRSLNVSILDDYNTDFDNKKKKFLEIITDKDNYDTWIDSSRDNFHIVNFSCNYSNMLANVQMSEADSPTLQFMGGMDTIYNIILETTDRTVISKIEQGRVDVDLLTRNNPKLRALGFCMLESELVELTGSLFVMIDTVATNTVPGFPGLYNVQITCVAYDIGQSEREQLEGFRPFDKVSFDTQIKQELDAGVSSFKATNFYPEGYDLVVAVDKKYEEASNGSYAINKIEDQFYYQECAIVRMSPDFPGEQNEDNWQKCMDKAYRGPAKETENYVFGWENKKTGSIVYYDPIDHLLYIPKNDTGNGLVTSPQVVADAITAKDDASYTAKRYKEAQCIEQSEEGLHTKISQDLYAENQIRTKMEVYPDLHLPTYAEVNAFIQKLIKFRKDNGLTDYPLRKYPTQPFNALFGCKDTIDSLPDAFHPSDIQAQSVVYEGFVDPDFYVFYVPYQDLDEYVGEEQPALAQRQARNREKIINENEEDITSRYITGNSQTSNGVADALITTACALIGDRRSDSQYNKVQNKNGIGYLGKYQFSGNQARTLLNDILAADETTTRQHLDNITIAELSSKDNWELKGKKKELTSNEINSIKGLLNTEVGKQKQDELAFTYMQDVLSKAYKKGLTNTEALLFYADCVSKYGATKVNDILTAGINGYQDYKGNTLDAVYNKALSKAKDSADKRDITECYQKIKNLAIDSIVTSLNNNATINYNLTEADRYNILKAAIYLIQGDLECTSNMPQLQRLIAQCFFDNKVLGVKDYQETCNMFINGKSNISDGTSSFTIDDYVDTTTEEYKAFKKGMYEAIDEVFCKGIKPLSQCCLHVMSNSSFPTETHFEDCEEIASSFDDNPSSHKHEEAGNKIYKLNTGSGLNLGDLGGITFWGCNQNSPTDTVFAEYNQENYDLIDQINNQSGSSTKTIKQDVKKIGKEDIKYFAEPLICKTKRLNNDLDFVKNTANKYGNVYDSCFTDMYQYSGRGRLVRAFPAYLFCILDDQAQWYDGRKLWANYYVYQSVIDIQLHATNDMATETAVITITNSLNNLNRTQAGLSGYTVGKDPAYLGSLASKWYKWTGMILGGIKITDKIIELHNILYDHARLREGARIHLRMGYGSDPFSLAPMINGHISEINLGDQISMIVTSDGHELIQNVMSAESKTNNGVLGLFGLGHEQEASNILACMMVERSSWLNYLFKQWYEASKYGLEHYGLYFHNKKLFSFDTINDLFDQCREHWDILMNIYLSNYDRELYCAANEIRLRDKEMNFVFDQKNMVPWDLAQLCAQQAPEYIVKSSYHQFDSRLFFGLPSFMERYRYDFFGGKPETIAKTESRTITTPAQIVVAGNKSNSGHFTETSYNSGWQPPEPPANAAMRECRFALQLKGHRLTSKEEKKDPDIMRVYGYKANGTRVLLASSLKDENAPCNLSLRDFESKRREIILSQDKLDGIVKVEFEAYCQHKNCCERNSECIEWEILYDEDRTIPGTTEEIITTEEKVSYENILYEELKAAAQVHYVDSMNNIIDNQITVTNKFSNTNVKCLYVLGHSPTSTPLLKSDDTIDASYQKTVVVDTPIVQNNIFLDQLWAKLQYKVGQRSAERVGISTLLYGWQQQYQGELILFGEPSIKPHDYIMVNDVYSNVYGLCMCREVVHSFNSSSGFTTSVTCGMIDFDTHENSGLITHCQNLLATLNAFSILTTTRLSHIHRIEQHIMDISYQLDTINKACDLMSKEIKLTNASQNAIAVAELFSFGLLTYKVITTAKRAADIKSFFNGIKDAVLLGFEGLKNASDWLSKAGIIARGIGTAGPNAISAGLGLGPHGWIWLVGIHVVLKIINSVAEYFSNKNCVILLPLLWENYPFVSGVKDGEKILLVPSNPNGTKENTKGSATINSSMFNSENANVSQETQEEKNEE